MPHLCTCLAVSGYPTYKLNYIRDKHGRRVYIYRSGKWNPDQVPYAEMYSMGIKIVEVLALEPKTQVAGVTIICDGKGYSMRQFAGMSIADIKLMMTSMEVYGSTTDKNAA